ncbi:hypothetical protein [Streptomyces sp. NPDC050564]|uniref:hypothetical protein n=1 Tax=Streptomyces sp. NPDC050564 TaxID=3365631 RepID=UPI0037A8429F
MTLEEAHDLLGLLLSVRHPPAERTCALSRTDLRKNRFEAFATGDSSRSRARLSPQQAQGIVVQHLAELCA